MNKANKLQKILMSGCLAVLVLFSATVLLRFVTRQVLILGMGMDNAFTRLVFFDNTNMQHLPGYQAMKYGDTDDRSFDWSVQYPFAEDVTAEVPKSEEEQTTAVQRYLQIVSSLTGKITRYTQDELAGYTKINELGNAYENLIRWNYSSYGEYNGIYRLSDGYWTALKSKKDMSEHIRAFLAFSEFCKENGTEFIYIQAPYKISKYEDTDVSGVVDFSNQNADDVIAGIRAEAVEVYDLRTEICEEGLSHHQLFYQSDHHWKGETGLWAAGKIAAYLNEHHGYTIDLTLFEPDRFDSVLYPEYFLGSLGRKVTLGRAKPEDFSLLYPKYETNLHFEVPSIGIDLNGDFSVTYNMEAVDGIDYYNKDPYHAYNYGDRAIIRYENLMPVQENKKVLVIHDSFGDCVLSFLALGLKDLEAIDLRYFNGSLESYIAESQPDTIIVMYNAGELSFEVDYTTHTNLYDFR